MNPTSFLQKTQLSFTTDGSTIASRLMATANTLRFEGDANSSVKLENISAPTSGSDVANKDYVDSLVGYGIRWLEMARTISITNLDLSTGYQNGSVVNGITIATGDRILLIAQTNGIENGVYDVQETGAPVRSYDALAGENCTGKTIFVKEGTECSGCAHVCTNADDSDVIGTDALVFTMISQPIDDSVIRTSGDQTLDGVKTFTSEIDANAGVKIDDGKSLVLGSDSDLLISHSGLAGSISNTTGDLTISTSGSTVQKLGSDDNSTSFEIQNNSSQALVTVQADGSVSLK